MPLQPQKAELDQALRKRVERYTADLGLAPATGDAAPDPTIDSATVVRGAPIVDTDPVLDSHPVDDPDDEREVFSIGAAFGGVSGVLDTGLPGIAFVTTYALSDSDLRLAVIVAVSCGAVLAVLRLVRRQPLQYALSGFFGVALAAYIASRTGRAVDFYLPGLLINAGYATAYTISILVRWPLIGVLVAAVQQKDLGGWRNDPVLLRAYSRASWIWVAMFGLKLAVQVPLYLADALGAIATARVAMGWPLLLVTIWLTYLVIKKSVPAGYTVSKLPAKPRDSAAPSASTGPGRAGRT